MAKITSSRWKRLLDKIAQCGIHSVDRMYSWYCGGVMEPKSHSEKREGFGQEWSENKASNMLSAGLTRLVQMNWHSVGPYAGLAHTGTHTHRRNKREKTPNCPHCSRAEVCCSHIVQSVLLEGETRFSELKSKPNLNCWHTPSKKIIATLLPDTNSYFKWPFQQLQLN